MSVCVLDTCFHVSPFGFCIVRCLRRSWSESAPYDKACCCGKYSYTNPCLCNYAVAARSLNLEVVWRFLYCSLCCSYTWVAVWWNMDLQAWVSFTRKVCFIPIPIDCSVLSTVASVTHRSTTSLYIWRRSGVRILWDFSKNDVLVMPHNTEINAIFVDINAKDCSVPVYILRFWFIPSTWWIFDKMYAGRDGKQGIGLVFILLVQKFCDFYLVLSEHQAIQRKSIVNNW